MVVARCADANSPEVGLLKNKTPEAVVKWYVEVYPRRAKDGKALALIRCDHGTEFKGAFQVHINLSGGRIQRALALKPQTNAKADDTMIPLHAARGSL